MGQRREPRDPGYGTPRLARAPDTAQAVSGLALSVWSVPAFHSYRALQPEIGRSGPFLASLPRIGTAGLCGEGEGYGQPWSPSATGRACRPGTRTTVSHNNSLDSNNYRGSTASQDQEAGGCFWIRDGICPGWSVPEKMAPYLRTEVPLCAFRQPPFTRGAGCGLNGGHGGCVQQGGAAGNSSFGEVGCRRRLVLACRTDRHGLPAMSVPRLPIDL